MASASTKASARERLLAAADELFYNEGVQTVGIDRVIEHAGVAKASLYNTFGSKEALVAAYLQGRHEGMVAALEDTMAAAALPRDKILAVFDRQARRISDADYRGCAFTAARTEAPDGGLIDQETTSYRTWLRSRLAGLAGEAGAADPAGVARQLHALYDGLATSARIDRDPEAGRAVRAAAEALLDAAIAAGRG